MTSLPDDAFRSGQVPANVAQDPYLRNFPRRFTYFNYPFLRFLFPATFANPNSTFSVSTQLAGDWLIYSPGPDADEFNRLPPQGPLPPATRVYIDYDPTNGTVSQGNVFRTQKSGERLGPHPLFQ
jgi:hypothetical protein